jgi:hypothetical protein
MPGTAVTKSVVANEPGGKKREEIFVDIIERISVTFSSSVSTSLCHALFITIFSSTFEDAEQFCSHSGNSILWKYVLNLLLLMSGADDACRNFTFNFAYHHLVLFCVAFTAKAYLFISYSITVKLTSVFTF